MKRLATGLFLSAVLLFLSCTSLPLNDSQADEKTASDRAAASDLANLEFPGIRCCDASELHFYFTGDTFLARAEQLIREARDYILIDSFLAVDDEKAKRVFGLLEQRMREGVRVYVITDSCSGFVSGFVEGRTAVPYLVQRGIPVAEFNPIRVNRLARLPAFEYRDHRKFWLIDGQILVLGGGNIWAPSLDPPEAGGTTDTMVEFRSAAAVREMIGGFVREWNRYSMDKLKPSSFAVRPRAGDNNCLWLVHQDRFTRPLMGRMFDRLLDAAQREVWLIQSYTLPDRSILRRIRDLTDRGVTVNILYSSAYHGMDKFYYATGYRMRDLLEAGAVLWVYDDPKSHLHYKGVIVDRQWFTVGSANFNYRSCHLSKEVNILFGGSDLGVPMLENLEELRRGSRRISLEEASSQRGLRFLFYYLFLFFGG